MRSGWMMMSCALALSSASCSKSSTPETKTDAVPAGQTIALGKATLLKKDVPYRIAGSEVVVVNRGASMRSVLVDGDPDKEDHVFSIRLEIRRGGEAAIHEVEDGEPLVVHGHRFTADAEGFAWGRADGAVIVERAP